MRLLASVGFVSIVEAADVDAPGRRRQEARDHPHRGGLAGAVRPEEAAPRRQPAVIGRVRRVRGHDVQAPSARAGTTCSAFIALPSWASFQRADIGWVFMKLRSCLSGTIWALTLFFFRLSVGPGQMVADRRIAAGVGVIFHHHEQRPLGQLVLSGNVGIGSARIAGAVGTRRTPPPAPPTRPAGCTTSAAGCLDYYSSATSVCLRKQSLNFSLNVSSSCVLLVWVLVETPPLMPLGG